VIFSKPDNIVLLNFRFIPVGSGSRLKISSMKNPLNNRLHASRLALLPTITLLMLSAFAVPQTQASTLIPGNAEFIGKVDVSALPPAAADIVQTVALPSFVLDGVAAAKDEAAKEGVQIQGGQDVITPKGSSFIHVQKSVEGIPGTNPNPCSCTPPDMGIGVSKKYVFQMVNLAGQIYSTSGQVVKPTFSLADFWFIPVRGGPLGIGLSDPVVVFDAGSGRWFASILNVFQLNRVRFAVSATDNPLGTWYIYQVSTPAANVLPDQPYIGYSDDKFGITANDFTIDTTTGAAAYLGVQFWILNKAQMMAGSGTVNLITNTPDSSKFAIRPAQHLSPTAIFYMVENCQTVSPLVLISICPATGAGGATLYAVTGVPPGPTLVTESTVEIDQTFFAPDAEQPGTTTLLATNDNRVLSVVWRQNKLWFALNDGCNPDGDPDDRSCARLVQLGTSGTSAPTVLQNFDLGILGAFVFYPALSTDTSQNLVLVFGTSSLTEFPSLKVSGQLSTQPIETLGPTVTVVVGNAPDVSTRYGDYFWAATEPNNPSTFWVAGEHRQISLRQGWSTQVARISFIAGS
jgi:hypothetical protein